MGVVVRPVPAELGPFVRSICCWAGEELAPGRERIMPSGTVSLMVNLAEDEFRTYDGPGGAVARRVRGAMLSGPRSAPVVIDTAEQRCVVDVSFRTGGAAPFFGLPLSETRDELVELGELWGRDGAVLRERMQAAATPLDALREVETMLLDRLAGPPRREPAIAYAVGALDRGAGVSEVVDRVGWSRRRFVREFRERVGLAPKRFARVRRLQRVLADAHRHGRMDWAEAADRHGFFDQSHLINDFRTLTGMTPAGYLAAVGDTHNHVPFSPIAAR